MQQKELEPAILLLDDGTVFHGYATGVLGTTTGEIAFNTGMTGYQEIFTDPSYFGQILVMTTSHIGNYGVHVDDVESNSLKISGLVTKKFSQIHSRAGAESSLQEYLVRDELVGICDIDTRSLVRHIREKGAMNAIISSETTDIDKLARQLSQVPSMDGLELSSKVTCQEAYEVGPTETPNSKVAVLDLGVKKNIVRCLVDRGCEVKVFPLTSSFDEIMKYGPDGIMFSNGPGDPSAMPETISLVGKLIETNVPCFGICLGHQIIALSQGLKTEKMFNGHRGVNHPVKNLLTGKCEITSQNHGFVVSRESLESHVDLEITHVHLNDDTVAGIQSKTKNVFSVQFHPEASAGPHDSRYLFDQFIHNIQVAQLQTVSQKN
jgi:carbamoyl-phosphate synthase small subunit